MDARARMTGTVDDRGRVSVPRAWRDALDLHPGDAVALETDGSGLRIVNVRKERAALVRRLRGSVTGGDSVDDLIADRRAEAAREADEA